MKRGVVAVRRFTPAMAQDAFEEGKHPREHGKFSPGSGSGGSSSGGKSSPIAPKRGTSRGYHEYLTSNGFKLKSVGDPIKKTNPVYEHPDGHRVVVDPSGAYTVYHGRGGRQSSAYTEGFSLGHLAQTIGKASTRRIRSSDYIGGAS